MDTNPGDVVIYVILVGIALFILAIALLDLKDELRRAVRTHRHRRSQRRYAWYARQARRRKSGRVP